MNEHLSDTQLLLTLDGELEPGELRHCRAHLAACPECRTRFGGLSAESRQIDQILMSAPVLAAQRARLNAALARRGSVRRVSLVRLALACAAGLILLAILFTARSRKVLQPAAPVQSAGLEPLRTFDVNGETFIAVGDSNDQLPVAAPHILTMKVPAAALMREGVIFEPVTDQVGTDQTVTADVMLGVDGEPLGVHVLE